MVFYFVMEDESNNNQEHAYDVRGRTSDGGEYHTVAHVKAKVFIRAETRE